MTDRTMLLVFERGDGCVIGDRMKSKSVVQERKFNRAAVVFFGAE
jgi:hypothetical protein